MSDVTASHPPTTWMADYTERKRCIFGEDFYLKAVRRRGGDINRKALEAFLKFGFEQGVCQRMLGEKELFAPQVLGSHKI